MCQTIPFMSYEPQSQCQLGCDIPFNFLMPTQWPIDNAQTLCTWIDWNGRFLERNKTTRSTAKLWKWLFKRFRVPDRSTECRVHPNSMHIKWNSIESIFQRFIIMHYLWSKVRSFGYHRKSLIPNRSACVRFIYFSFFFSFFFSFHFLLSISEWIEWVEFSVLINCQLPTVKTPYMRL